MDIFRRFSIKGERLITFNEANSLISGAILDAIPFASGKLGGTETRAIFHADRFLQLDWPYSMSWLKYARQLYVQAGVFPISKITFKEFTEYYRNHIISEIDYIFLWQSSVKEILTAKRHSKKSVFFDWLLPGIREGIVDRKP